MTIDPSKYRKSVGIMLLNAKNEIFVGKRLDSSEAWQMPQGGIDHGESPETAAFRELFEETNILHAKIIYQSSQWLHYDLPEKIYKNLWNGMFIGQMQKWFLMKFEGQESEINIFKNHNEFADWKWVSQVKLLETIVPFKKDLYIKILEEFSPFLK